MYRRAAVPFHRPSMGVLQSGDITCQTNTRNFLVFTVRSLKARTLRFSDLRTLAGKASERSSSQQPVLEPHLPREGGRPLRVRVCKSRPKPKSYVRNDRKSKDVIDLIC